MWALTDAPGSKNGRDSVAAPPAARPGPHRRGHARGGGPREHLEAQVHRWLSVARTAAVIANIVVIARGGYIDWVGYLAVAPLMLLLASGLYMFVLPYAARWRRGADPAA